MEVTMQTLMKNAKEALLQRRSRLGARGGLTPPPVEGEGRLLSEQELRELREIDEALTRMAEGQFGRCARCGGAIGRYRLRAVPEARYCLTCHALVAR